MSDPLMKKALDAVWPRGSAWTQKIGGGMEGFLLGVSDSLELVRIKLATLAIIRDPELTEQLDELEIDFGITPDPTLTDAVRRSRLFTRINVEQTAGTRDRMERDLQAAGFDLFVHANTQGIAPLLEMPLENSLDLLLGEGSASFTRASTATYIDQNSGLLKYAVIGEPRFEAEGLLMEGVSGNKILHSSDFTNAVWADPVGSWTPTANTTNAPDGTLTADTITLDATSALIRQSLTAATGSSFSVWMQLLTGNITGAIIDHNDGPGVSVFSQLVSGEIVRVGVEGLIKGVGGNFLDIQVDGDIGATFAIWGAQLEELPFPTSYIPTTAAPVTRVQDLMVLPYAGNMPDISDDMTVICDYKLSGFTGNYQTVWDVNGETHRVFHPEDPGGDTRAHHGPDVLIIGPAPLSSRHGYVYDSNAAELRLYQDGVKVATQATPAAITGTAVDIHIGSSQVGTAPMYGHLSNLRIYDRALTTAQLNDPGAFPYTSDPLQFASSFLTVAGGVTAFAGEPTAVAEVFLADILVNGAFIRTVAVWRTVAGGGDAFAGEPGAIAEQTGSVDLVFEYSIPTDPEDWPLVFFVGGPAVRDGSGALISIEIAQVPALRRAELEQTVLRLKPLHSWAVMMVEYT